MVTFYHHLFHENQKSHISPRFRKRRRSYHSRTDFEEYRNIYEENVFACARFDDNIRLPRLDFPTTKRLARAIGQPFFSSFSKTTQRDMREKTGRSDVIQKKSTLRNLPHTSTVRTVKRSTRTLSPFSRIS